MVASATDGMYWEFHFPLGLHHLIEELLRRQHSTNLPTFIIKPAVREWISQPRVSTDNTTEVISVNFRLPLSISELSFEARRVSCRIEVWYRDRQNNWRQMLDGQRIPIALTLSHSDAISWYKFHTFVYPIVAKSVQIRITRVADRSLENNAYSVALRNTLIRRNIYDRADGMQFMEDEQDALGNILAKYIKDWDAPKAIDNDTKTYWRSAPMPDPDAVCSLYLDTRQPDGSPQLIDKIYIDPVYTYQTLNVYYSNDDTVGTRKLSPISLAPETDVNTEWKGGEGLSDISTSGDPQGTTQYYSPVAWGPLTSEACWIGIEWAADFVATSGPPVNPVLLEVIPADPTTDQWWPKIYYDVGASEIVLEFSHQTEDPVIFSAVISPLLVQYSPLRIVVGWKYGPDTVYLSVVNKSGTEIAHVVATPPDLPSYVSLDGKVGFSDFRGTFTAHIIKLEDYELSSAAFVANPSVYVSPDPVVPDAFGRIPPSTLDDAIFAADWTIQQYPTGGTHESHYEDKEWTPVWRDYVTQKGNLILPQQLSMKYLKLEFTNLTEEAYPIFDSGINVTYKIFPVSVIQLAIKQHPSFFGVISGILTLGVDIMLGAIGAVNWVNPTSIVNAVNAIHGKTVQPVEVYTGTGFITDTVPQSVLAAISTDTRTEMANPYVYRRPHSNVFSMIGHAYRVVKQSTPIQGTLPTTVDEFWDAIAASAPAPSGPTSAAPLPIQGQDWWVFPGQTLKLPATVMQGLTKSETCTWRKKTLEARIRFPTASVHRYDVKTVKRDAAIAYFAGIREVSVLSTSYIATEDPAVFRFTTYDPAQWVLTGINKLASGPVTSTRGQFVIENPGFDMPDPYGALYLWDADGSWVWDSDPLYGRWYPGTARAAADGTDQTLNSTHFDVQPTWTITASVWVSWESVTVPGNGAAFQFNAVTYLDHEPVGLLTFDEVTYADWSTHGDQTWIELTGTVTIPPSVDSVRLQLKVLDAATAGTVWFDTVTVWSDDTVGGTLYKDLITTSSFNRVKVDYQDSGLMKSDSMWAQADPLATNIDKLALAFYSTTIPDFIPSGTWADTFAEWGDPETAWGTPRAVVAIDVDPNRIYDGKRVLHFRRAGGYEEAGVKVRQTTNFVRNGLFRICVVFYKPSANENTMTLRLRRVSDGVYIYEQAITPATGYWHTFKTPFVEIPDSPDQFYTVEMVLTGDDPDELYLSDLYCEISQIRYFLRLGGSDQFLHDVTPLRYADSAIVSCTSEVTEVELQVAVLTDRAFAYGCSIVPQYLK